MKWLSNLFSFLNFSKESQLALIIRTGGSINYYSHSLLLLIMGKYEKKQLMFLGNKQILYKKD